MSKDSRFFHNVFSKYGDLSKEQLKLALCNVTTMYTADNIKIFPVSEKKGRSEEEEFLAVIGEVILASARESRKSAVKQYVEYEGYCKSIKAKRHGGWVC
ncbi:hypothetical protein BTJ40_04890 [Microbulbifer sp. A4B17]|uniref:hypothetical protein n=1 Tax=Microbulbifer sp. A4B17 TaxID=359370 RepID=UPI000D52AF90|nr:hypothetical protein [Microbulbifer sp. A4B17]AWF80198.1 hypothetical protein BTJ40_04890 [Microbulbifer sp. A4B17]